MRVSHSAGISIGIIGAFALAISGCNNKQPAVNAPAGVTDAASIELSLVDRPGYDARVAKHRGKVVLVDFWATWCGPCVEQLLHTMELADQYRDRGLTVICVSCDEPSELEPVRALLQSKGAGVVENLVSQFGGSQQSMEAFEISSGALPAYKLYDRNGKLRQAFELNLQAKRQFTPKDIEAAVEALLEE